MSSETFPRCANCGSDIQAIPRTNFYGLRKLTCQQCRQTSTLPMRAGYRIAFYAVALWMVIGLATRLVQGGNVWVPALLLVIAIAALVQDQKIQGTQFGIKRWIGNLHGGQLLMMILLLAVVGLVPNWFGYTLYIVPANRAYAFATDVEYGNATLGLASDTAAARVIRASASEQVGTGMSWVVLGLAVWLLAVPMLWWWFSARRRLS
jgi:hypothetical protein